LIEFGRFARDNRQRRGQGKPETFDFLGFTHCCGKTRNGKFTVLRLIGAKRMRAKLHAVKDEMRQRMHPSPSREPTCEAWWRGMRATSACPTTASACRPSGSKWSGSGTER